MAPITLYIIDANGNIQWQEEYTDKFFYEISIIQPNLISGPYAFFVTTANGWRYISFIKELGGRFFCISLIVRSTFSKTVSYGIKLDNFLDKH
jgi:hypothetical protein